MCAILVLGLSMGIHQRIGVHMGMILPAIFGFVFGKQALKHYATRDTDPRFYLFMLMLMGSALALKTIIATKPKKEDKESKE